MRKAVAANVLRHAPERRNAGAGAYKIQVFFDWLRQRKNPLRAS
jgi:hypothetical protein